MRHRHLDDIGTADIGPAAIDDLLDRGDLDDWSPLAARIRADPHGQLADTVLRLCREHPMYGTSTLWRTWIERLRGPTPEAYSLADLRRRNGLTQHDVAERMSISQSDVSKLERRRDVRVSSLAAYLRAIGSNLELVARQTDGSGANLRLPEV